MNFLNEKIKKLQINIPCKSTWAILWPLFFGFFLLIGIKQANANDNFLVGYETNNCTFNGIIGTEGFGGGWGPYIFDIPATTTNFSKIDLKLKGNETLTARIRFCSGPYDVTTTLQANEQCVGNAQQLFYEQDINITTTDSVNYQWYTFDLSDFSMSYRPNNFFSLTRISGGNNTTRCINRVGDFPGGFFSNPTITNFDTAFRVNYNPYFVPPDTENTNTTPNYDTALLDWRSDINTVEYMMCFLGDTNCKLFFSFNDKAIGKQVFITPDVLGQQNPQNSYFMTTIYYRPEWQNEIDIPTYTEPDKRDYCLYLIDPDYGDLLHCGVTIEWIATSTFFQRFDGRFPENEICASVATSTGSILEDVRYSIECGFRRLLWWAFKADEKSLQDFTNSREQLKQAFPFNTYFQINTAISNAISTTTDMAGIGSMPMINKSGEYYMLPVLSSSSVPNLIGEKNNNLFRTTLGWVAWLAVAGFIYATVKQ